MFGDKESTRNLILAAVLSMAVVFLWQVFFMPPPEVQDPAANGEITGTPADLPPATAVIEDRTTALAGSLRVDVANDGAVHGSISLTGARLDDLHLDDYNETLEGADTVTLLNPTATALPYFATFGWQTVAGGTTRVPDAESVWEVESGETLTPATPVTLRWDNGEGLIFRLTWEIDDRYMFTVTQSVENTTEADVALLPYGEVQRRGLPELTNFYILHEGPIGAFDGILEEIDYDDMLEFSQGTGNGGRFERYSVSQNGWLGFTDRYWMTTLVPPSGQSFDAILLVEPGSGRNRYRVLSRLPATSIPPGETVATETRLFAGAKELDTIADYEETLGIDSFYESIDWGWFYFLTKPFFVAPVAAQQPDRQYGRRDHRDDADHQGGAVPARLQVLRLHVADEAAPAGDAQDQGALRRRQA